LDAGRDHNHIVRACIDDQEAGVLRQLIEVAGDRSDRRTGDRDDPDLRRADPPRDERRIRSVRIIEYCPSSA